MTRPASEALSWSPRTSPFSERMLDPPRSSRQMPLDWKRCFGLPGGTHQTFPLGDLDRAPSPRSCTLCARCEVTELSERLGQLTCPPSSRTATHSRPHTVMLVEATRSSTLENQLPGSSGKESQSPAGRGTVPPADWALGPGLLEAATAVRRVPGAGHSRCPVRRCGQRLSPARHRRGSPPARADRAERRSVTVTSTWGPRGNPGSRDGG